MTFIKDYNKTAIIYDGNNISYKEMIRKSKGYSEIIDLKSEDRVVIYMENRPEFFYSFLSIWEKKGVCVCLDSSFTSKELEFYLVDSNPKYIFTSDKNKESVKLALLNLNLSIKIIIVDEEQPEYQGESLVIDSPNPEDTVLMLYTSGTTGSPKGVMLTFDNILVNIEGLDTYKMYEDTDIVLALLPMHHIFPLLGAGIVPFAKGATIVFLKEISSQAMINSFKENKVTFMIGVPRLWEALHKKILEKINASFITRGIFKIMEKLQNKSLSKKIFGKVHEEFGGNLRFFVSGGSKLNPQIAKDFLTLGIDICEGYGLTETAPMICFTPINQVIPGAGGKLLPGVEVKFTKDGEILARGRNVMKGYYNNPVATSKVIDSEGWFHTGDLGELKNDYLYITGRKKEMIVLSNGKNINPIEIEMWLEKNSNLIQEIAVIEYNSLLTVVIYPNFQKIHDEGITNILETFKWGVIDKYNSTAPSYKKILDIIIIQEEFPKTKLGKIRRFLIKDIIIKTEDNKVNTIDPDFEEYRELKKFLFDLKGKNLVSTAHLELDLGLDSLDITELLVFIHYKFGIKAEQELLLKYSTVKELAEYLKDNATDIKIEEKNWVKELNTVPPRNLKYNIVGKIIRILFKPFFFFYIKQKTLGKENILKEPAIYVGNHQSFADSFLFNNAVSNGTMTKIYYLAKVKHFNSKIMKLMADNSNIIIVDINKNVSNSLKSAASILKSGGSIVIFPEGVRTRNGHMLEFKKTFAILAKELNIPIVPFGIKGAYELFPSNQKYPKSGNVELKFFENFRVKDLSYDEIVLKTRNIIKNWVE
ncbi:MAG: AMP-binding protein [Fusobacteriaceae bacterium]